MKSRLFRAGDATRRRPCRLCAQARLGFPDLGLGPTRSRLLSSTNHEDSHAQTPDLPRSLARKCPMSIRSCFAHKIHQSTGSSAREYDDLFLLSGDVLDCERNRGRDHVDDHVHTILVEPFASRRRADIGFVLVICRYDLDSTIADFASEFLDREFGGGERSFARDIGIRP